MFNQYQAVISTLSGDFEFAGIKKRAASGNTPPPCPLAEIFLPGFLTTSEAHPNHNEEGLGQSGASIFHLSQARVGTVGQIVDTTLNDCGFSLPLPPPGVGTVCSNVLTSPGVTTPWIYSVIRFDAEGNLAPMEIDTSIFPSHAIYIDNHLVATIPQSDPEPFIAKDRDNSARLPNEIP